MSAKYTLLLLSDEPETSAAVATVLDVDGRFALDQTCHTVGELTSQLQNQVFPAALVDIDANPEFLLEELATLARKFPETRFIAISKELQGQHVLAAMKAGAKHFLVKNSISPELVEVLGELMPNEESDGSPPKGAVITVLSAGGGCGATTIAINLADRLQRRPPSRRCWSTWTLPTAAFRNTWALRPSTASPTCWPTATGPTGNWSSPPPSSSGRA